MVVESIEEEYDNIMILEILVILDSCYGYVE